MSTKEAHFVRGALAGMVGGLVASWVMNRYVAGPGQKLVQAAPVEEQANTEGTDRRNGLDEDATMKAADAVVATVTGGQHLSHEERRKGGPIVHYTFGAIMGGLYGGLSEYSSAVRTGFGTGFGGALFAGADLFAVPALKLSATEKQQELSDLALPFTAHLVYGTTTDFVRRLVRPLL